MEKLFDQRKVSNAIVAGALHTLVMFVLAGTAHADIDPRYSGTFNMESCSTFYDGVAARPEVLNEIFVEGQLAGDPIQATSSLKANTATVRIALQQNFVDSRSVEVEEIFGPSVTDVELGKAIKAQYCQAQYRPKGIPKLTLVVMGPGSLGGVTIPLETESVVAAPSTFRVVCRGDALRGERRQLLRNVSIDAYCN